MNKLGIVAQRYKLMYDDDKVSKEGLQKVVGLKLISKEEYKIITNEDFPS